MKLSWRRKTPHPTNSPEIKNLADTYPGSQVRIVRFGDLSPSHLQHLNAYGVLPNRTVKVLALHPLVIIQVEHCELALEDSIARQIIVEYSSNTL